MVSQLVLGNIITLDESQPLTQAVFSQDGIIKFVGDAQQAKEFCDASTQIVDYGHNYIYPGFLEPHTHGFLAGYRALGQADVSQITPTNYDKYKQIIKKYIEDNPKNDYYIVAGWEENETYITKDYLDQICPDKPMAMNTGGGHSALLNTKALELCGIDADFAKNTGYDLVHVDKDGNPDGYICEGPCIELLKHMPIKAQEAKKYLLNWQDTMFKKGFTAVADAGADLFYKDAPKIYNELEKQGKLKLRTVSYKNVPDNPYNTAEEVDKTLKEIAKYNGEYFCTVGLKVFLDGVTEAHTGWQLDDYKDDPGYHGIERFNNHKIMVKLLVDANAKGLPVHAHCEGDGATHFMLDCIQEAQKITGNKDQRNLLAHLHFVAPEDIKKMADTKSIALVAPLWVSKVKGEYDNEVKYVGKEKADKAYPIKSFIDAGAKIAFHSDYPISPNVDVPRNIFMACMRHVPEKNLGGIQTLRGKNEAISRMDALLAMTKNVAYAWRMEHKMGSLEVGKLANMAVYNCDFLNDEASKVAASKCVATIVDGQEVYRA